ncbi:MAG: SulP family inorganic anion transporter, partial [Chromatiales bacterium]|nr:SulP family inorganic anion transporter [Chromatiales bacterium]
MNATTASRSWSWLIPFMAWMPRVSKRDFRTDLIAGLTGAIVVLPQGVAFATIAGMPPEYGLYAGMIPAIIAALFGSSKHLVSGPTTAASIVLFSALSVYAEPGTMDYVALALTLTFMVGILELALGLARMGALVNFISHSVVVGFTAGAAILIAAKQLKYFFGIEMSRGGHVHDILIEFFQQLGNINPYVTAVSLFTLLSGIAINRWFPRLPYMIVAMLGGSLLAVLLDWWFGSEVTQIATVGALPASLPPLSAPSLTLENIKNLAPSAFAVTLFALTEAVSIGRSLAARGGYRINGNQEFIGQGLSNIAGAFTSGYVATGSFNRSGLNFQAGAKTPLAAVFAGLLLMIIVVLVAPLAAYLPKAAMAGILFLVAWGLIDFHEMAHILKSSGRETAVLAITFFGALFLELEFAIFAGVLFSLVLYLERVSKPRIHSRAPDPHAPKRAFSSERWIPECPQLKIIRIDGSIFFGSVNHVQETLEHIREQSPGQKHLALVADGINFVDLQGGEALAAEAKRRKADGGEFYMIRVKEGLWDTL